MRNCIKCSIERMFDVVVTYSDCNNSTAAKGLARLRTVATYLAITDCSLSIAA